MSNRFQQTFIDEILSKADIVDTISSRVKLKKAGHEYSGLCPFHSEKTPSFTVSPQKRFYYCFGCGANGNVINFMMQFDHAEFRTVVTQLAQHLGIPCPETQDDQQQYQLNHAAKHLMQKIQRYYQQQLQQNTQALQYLNARGLSDQVIHQYGLGFSPKYQKPLHQILNLGQQDIALLQRTGMIYTDDQGRHNTRFRGRLIFPIRNFQGETVGFGGRQLTEGRGPKYLNSPETELFKKSFELYGLYEAKQMKKKLERLIVVEGYMDVISLAQHGVYNAVATLGTAINAQHIRNLARQAQHIAFCFDGDAAGQRAAWRAFTQSLPIMHDGLHLSFVFLPQNEDPDSFIQKQGKSKFAEYFKQAKPATEFFFEHIFKNHRTDTLSGRAAAAQEALELIQTIPNGIFKHLMQQQLEITLSLGKDTLAQLNPAPPSRTPRLRIDHDHLSQVISMLLQCPSIYDAFTVSNLLKEQTDTKIQWLLTLQHTIQDHPMISTAGLLQRWEKHEAYPWLVKLAMQPHLLSETAFAVECNHRLETLKDQLIQEKINVILSEAKLRGLSTQEKQALNMLIKLKVKRKQHSQSI